MNKANILVDRIKVGLVFALLAALTGCVGYVDGGGGYGGVIVAPEPDVYLFGGGYDRGRDVRGYSDRGSASRAVAHPSGGGGGRPSGGGGGHPSGGGGGHQSAGGGGGRR